MKKTPAIPIAAVRKCIPVRYGIFGTSWLDCSGLAIACVQGGRDAKLLAPWRWRYFPMHVGNVFECAPGQLVGFESRFSEGYVCISVNAKLAEYSTPTKRMRILWIPGLTHDQVAAKWGVCLRAVENALPYAKTQFLAYLGHEKKGWAMPDTPCDAVCSESVARTLAYETNLYDFRSHENPTHDSLTPYEVWDNAVKTVAAVQGGRQ